MFNRRMPLLHQLSKICSTRTIKNIRIKLVIGSLRSKSYQTSQVWDHLLSPRHSQVPLSASIRCPTHQIVALKSPNPFVKILHLIWITSQRSPIWQRPICPQPIQPPWTYSWATVTQATMIKSFWTARASEWSQLQIWREPRGMHRTPSLRKSRTRWWLVQGKMSPILIV